MQEGYFVAFRNVGLPIRTEDYDNPHSPIGVNLNKDRRTPRRPRRGRFSSSLSPDPRTNVG
jgi:hypothetical protein